MLFSNLVHLKGLLMVLTAAVGTVSLSLFCTDSKLPASLSPGSVNVPVNGTAKSTVTVTATNTIGSFNVVIVGIASSHGKTNYASTELSVQVVSNQDFTITSSPSSIVNTFGSSNTTTITVTSLNGYTGTVSLTVTAPFGYITVMGNQNPLILSAGGTTSSTLNITTSLSTTLGTYNVTVTGTAGSRTHSTVISLTVIDPIVPPPIIESLKLTGYQFINGTSLSLVL